MIGLLIICMCGSHTWTGETHKTRFFLSLWAVHQLWLTAHSVKDHHVILRALEPTLTQCPKGLGKDVGSTSMSWTMLHSLVGLFGVWLVPTKFWMQSPLITKKCFGLLFALFAVGLESTWSLDLSLLSRLTFSFFYLMNLSFDSAPGFYDWDDRLSSGSNLEPDAFGKAGWPRLTTFDGGCVTLASSPSPAIAAGGC